MIENNRITCVRTEEKDSFSNGDVLICKVIKKKKDLKGYFVSLNGKDNGLILEDDCFKKDIKQGDEILVQIKKEAYENKVCTVSDRIEIVGKYCVIKRDLSENASNRLSFSKKLNPQRKNEINTYLSSRFDACDYAISNYSITIRTESINASDEDIFGEVEANILKLRQMEDKSIHTPVYSVLHRNNFICQVTNDNYYSDIKIVCCDDDSYNFALELSANNVNVERFNDDRLTPGILYGLSQKLEDITNNKVWLKSGGYIFIDKTAAMTVIDVNLGKANYSGDKEKCVLAANLDALDEIVYQIGARNISGIIIIDFINMKTDDSKTILIDKMRKTFSSIKPRINYVGMTHLGLVEATREKKHVDIYETIKKLDRTILR